MKRAFVLRGKHNIVSDLVPDDTRDVLLIGDRIKLTRLIDLGPGARIPAGSQGTVDFIDDDTGTADVLMDTVFPGLSEWQNHMWLEPFGTEDILTSIRVSRGTVRSYRAMVPHWSTAVAASLLFAFGATLVSHLTGFSEVVDNPTFFTRSMLLSMVVVSIASHIS